MGKIINRLLNRITGRTMMMQDISVNVGAKVRTMRIARGLSVAQTARLIGCTSQQLLRSERGDIRIHVDMLYQLSLIFGCEVKCFFEDILREPD